MMDAGDDYDDYDVDGDDMDNEISQEVLAFLEWPRLESLSHRCPLHLHCTLKNLLS